MRDDILPEFQNFVDSGAEYKESAAYIESVMNDFAEKTDVLEKEMVEIASSIAIITNAISS